jgi:Family of unknown function (DUF6166)
MGWSRTISTVCGSIWAAKAETLREFRGALSMKTYRGYRRMHLDNDGQPISCECVVTVTSRNEPGYGKFQGRVRTRPLKPRNDIRDHSPTGFEWGYGGSGPAQLALALVADCCGREWAMAVIYQRVKASIVAGLPHDGWQLTEDQVKAAVEAAKESAGKEAVEQCRAERQLGL